MDRQMYALIPAGGSGKRLWPLSRSNHPKHLLKITGNQSMIQETVSRLQSLTSLEKIFVITAESHCGEVGEHLQDLPDGNILIEPARRDTAAAIGLGLMQVYNEDPEALVASFHSDHLIAKEREFKKLIRRACLVASSHDAIVTIGIAPSYAATNFGYIATGEEFTAVKDTMVFRVEGFREKPNFPTAQAFLAAGNYFWNAGIFIGKVQFLIEKYKQHVPKIFRKLQEIYKHYGQKDFDKVLREIYPSISKVPIDMAIMEKVSEMLVIPADIGWSDLGTWNELHDTLPLDKHGNFEMGEHVRVDTVHSLVYGQPGKLVATIGLENMIVVDTPDALLVVPKDRCGQMKDLLQKIKNKRKKQYL